MLRKLPIPLLAAAFIAAITGISDSATAAT
jgi:hypothetical protein